MASYEIVFKTKAELEGAQAMMAATDKEIGKLKALQSAGVATEKQLARLGTLQGQQSKMAEAMPSLVPDDPSPNSNPIDKKGLVKSIKALKHELHGVPGLWEASMLLKGGTAAGLIGATMGIAAMVSAIQKAKAELKEWAEIQEGFKPFDESKIGGNKIKIASEFASRSFAHEMDSIQRKVSETSNTLEKQFSKIEADLGRFKERIEAELQAVEAEEEAKAAARGVKVNPADRRKRERNLRSKLVEAEKQAQAIRLAETRGEINAQSNAEFAAFRNAQKAQEEIDQISKSQEEIKDSPARKEFEFQLKQAGMTEAEFNKKVRKPFKSTNSPYDALRRQEYDKETEKLDGLNIARKGADQESTKQERLKGLMAEAEKRRSEAQEQANTARTKKLQASENLNDQIEKNAIVIKQLEAIEKLKQRTENANTSMEANVSARTQYSGPNNQAEVVGILMQISAGITGMRQELRGGF